MLSVSRFCLHPSGTDDDGQPHIALACRTAAATPAGRQTVVRILLLRSLVVLRRGHGCLRVEVGRLGLLAGGALHAVDEHQVALAQLLVHGALVPEAGVGACRHRKGKGNKHK